MVTGERKYSVVVPVHNEAATLPETLPALLAATNPDRAEITYVCNGCTDASADVIRHLAGPAVTLIEIPARSKTAALNAADAQLARFPRIYLDADILIEPGGIDALADVLIRGDADLVSPALGFDTRRCTGLARAISDIWQGLPHARQATFHAVIGLSASGRRRWGWFPDLIGDDIFMEAMIPADRRLLVGTVKAVTRPPRRFWTWVGVRARWRRGERELSRMGVTVVRTAGQHQALLALLCRPKTAFAAATFILARLLAEVASRFPQKRDRWFSDRPHHRQATIRPGENRMQPTSPVRRKMVGDERLELPTSSV